MTAEPIVAAAGPSVAAAAPKVDASDREAKSHFRPDIEGLRAVAIVAVLLFHAGVPGASGGFIGVDVFFVISGFLITGLLVREWSASKRIDLVRFYARRFRRLLPASLLTIVVTLVASYLILSELRFPTVAGDGAASALYVANLRFASQATDYLAGEQAPSPFLHFWSLGVEEQFYLFWPLMILLSLRIMSVGRLGITLAVVAITSLAAAVIWTDVSAPWAFFSLPTRAWQLAVGALIAVGVLRLPRRTPELVRSLAVWAGLVLIGISIVMFGADTPYPGTSAIVPVLGAALVIVGGTGVTPLPSRLLTMRLPRWLGRISYSLYLWHWPLLILVPIALGIDDLAFRLALVGVAIAIAAASTELIEVPIRSGRRLPLTSARSVLVGLSSSAAVAIGAVGTVAILFAPVGPGTLPPEGSIVAARLESLPAPVRTGPVPAALTPTLAQAYWDLPKGYHDGCHLDFASLDPPTCAYGDLESDTTVMLLGDSHAQQWLPALETVAQDRGWRLVAITKAACPMVDVPVWNSVLQRRYRECDQWRERALELVDSLHPALVFLSSANMYEVVDDSGTRIEDSAAAWRAGLVSAYETFAAHAPAVIVLADTPRVGYDPAECLATNPVIEDCDASAARMVDSDYQSVEAAAAAQAHVGLVSETAWLCPGDDCPLIRGDYLVFRDRHHITATFSSVLAVTLGAAIDDTLGAGGLGG